MKMIKCPKSELTWNYAYIIVILVYALSHGLMLALYGAWWDDMVFWNVSPEFLKEFMGPSNFNNPFMYYITRNISQISSPPLQNLVFRLFPFLCYFISISCFFLFVKKATNNLSYTFYSSLLAASCGLNKCMTLICCYHYAISISLFMIGLVFFTYDFFNSKFTYKLIVSVLWTLSLLIWRTAVLVIPVALLITTALKTDFNWKNKDCYKTSVLYLFRNYGIIIAGLLIFSILYKTILAPQSDYAAYYSTDMLSMVLSPLTTFTSCCSLLAGYWGNLLAIFTSVGAMGYKVVLFILVLIFILFLIHKKQETLPVSPKILWLAIFFLFFSIMPYLLREISFGLSLNGYKSRYTSLAIFPISMIMAYAICRFSRKMQIVIITCAISLSIINSLFIYIDYSKSWAKNEAIALFFKNNNLNDKKLIIIDNTQNYSPFEEDRYRYYEFEGCARLAYGVYSTTQCEVYSQKNSDSGFIPDYYLYIDIKNPENKPSIVGIKNLLYRYWDKNKHNEMIDGLFMFRLLTKEEFVCHSY